MLFQVSQSVKEVLQSLVDDGQVSADKIGSSNCKPVYALKTTPSKAYVYSSLLEFSVSARCERKYFNVPTIIRIHVHSVGTDPIGYCQRGQPKFRGTISRNPRVDCH